MDLPLNDDTLILVGIILVGSAILALAQLLVGYIMGKIFRFVKRL